MKKQSPPWFKPFLIRLLNSTAAPFDLFQAIVKNNEIVRIPMARHNYVVNHPDAIYHILLTNRDNYTKAGTSYERIENVVGKGVLTTSGDEWAVRRQEFQPAFQGRHLKHHVPTIQKYTEYMLRQWELKSGQVVNMNEEMLALVMNISSEMMLGIDISSRSLDMVRMIHILNQYSIKSATLWKWLPTLGNLRYQFSKKMIDKYILSSINNSSSSQEPILKNLLLKDESGNFINSPESILGEVKNFFIAGHETTGNGLSWLLYCLAKNPYVLTKVNEELKSVLKNSLPDFDNIENLPYLEMVIEETLRLYPPIWIFTRKSIAEDTLLDYTIPANAIINIVPYLMHRHPKYWNQPDIFYPERFLPEISKTRPKCAYIPFGFGPRVCIARQLALLNMKIVVVMILQKFEISLPHKNYTVEPLPLITLKPKKNNLRIKKLQ